MSRLLIQNANLVDSLNGIRMCRAVLVEDGIIKDCFAQAEPMPQADQTIDLEGGWLSPGLVDMHVHLCAEAGRYRSGMSGGLWRMATPSPLKAMHVLKNARLGLMAGFTTLRNCGHVTYYTPEDVALREAVGQGLVDGPNIFACAGQLTMTAGHGDLSFSRFVRRLPEYNLGDRCFDGPAGALEGVREKVRLGADFIKIMASGGMGSSGDEPEWPNFRPEELKIIVEESHDLEKKVAAHCHSEVSAQRCIEAGVDTIEHGCALTDDLCRMMADKGLFLVPTLRVVNILLDSNDREEAAKAKKLVDVHERAFQSAMKHGVKIAYGTDTINALKHGENGLEALNMRQAGMDDRDIFKAMTYTAAEALGVEQRLGSLSAGKQADLIATRRNPWEDISELAYAERIKLVVSRGSVVKNTLAVH